MLVEEATKPAKRVRCAGLYPGLNRIRAPIRTRYDDGGYSGGSTDRPALQRLLADIRDRRIDIVVVYKVDRLTRSLADFAKLVELFDQHSVSFTRTKLVTAIARGRQWLSEIEAGAATIDGIAVREACSKRHINMTISLAFLAPSLVKAAVEGRLPGGSASLACSTRRSCGRASTRCWGSRTDSRCVLLSAEIPCSFAKIPCYGARKPDLCGKTSARSLPLLNRFPAGIGGHPSPEAGPCIFRGAPASCSRGADALAALGTDDLPPTHP
jgi:hypothetical protein